MGSFDKTADYDTKQLEEAVAYYMDLYGKYRGNMPKSVKVVAGEYSVPESTLYGRVTRAKKRYDEEMMATLISPPEESAEGEDESDAKGYSLTAPAEEVKEQHLWAFLAEEQRKNAAIALRKQYGKYQEDSLATKMRLQKMIHDSLYFWDEVAPLTEKLEDSVIILNEAGEAGDATAKLMIKTMQKLIRILEVYASPRAIKELTLSQKELEMLIASQFGLPYGNAAELAKTKELEARVEFHKAKTDQIKGDSQGFDYSTMVNSSVKKSDD